MSAILKRSKGGEKLHAFSNQVSEDTVCYILSIKQLNGFSEVRDHEIYKIYVQVSTFRNIYLAKNELDITEIAVHIYVICTYIHTMFVVIYQIPSNLFLHIFYSQLQCIFIWLEFLLDRLQRDLPDSYHNAATTKDLNLIEIIAK